MKVDDIWNGDSKKCFPDLFKAEDAPSFRDYCCDFALDSRFEVLVNSFRDYYLITENMNNKDAMVEWKALRGHCYMLGLNNVDFQRAKQIASGMR